MRAEFIFIRTRHSVGWCLCRTWGKTKSGKYKTTQNSNVWLGASPPL